MSDQPTPENVTSINVNSNDKPNLIKRGINFVKTHKKATISVSVLAGLVVAGVALDRAAGPVVFEPVDVMTDSPEAIDSVSLDA